MTTRDKESSSSSSTSSVTDSGRPLAARGHAALENFYRSGQDGELSWRLCVLCRGIATWPIRLADHHVKTHGADCPVATLEAALAQERPNERSNTHPVADTGVTEPTHPSAAARVHALIAQWRERARRVRPLESEPVTAEKRERAAEWMHFTARAIELEAALAAALAPGLRPGETLSEETYWVFSECRGNSKGTVVLTAEQATHIKEYLGAAALAPQPEQET